jgi:hypothetical protein
MRRIHVMSTGLSMVALAAAFVACADEEERTCPQIVPVTDAGPVSPATDASVVSPDAAPPPVVEGGIDAAVEASVGTTYRSWPGAFGFVDLTHNTVTAAFFDDVDRIVASPSSPCFAVVQREVRSRSGGRITIDTDYRGDGGIQAPILIESDADGSDYWEYDQRLSGKLFVPDTPASIFVELQGAGRVPAMSPRTIVTPAFTGTVTRPVAGPKLSVPRGSGLDISWTTSGMTSTDARVRATLLIPRPRRSAQIFCVFAATDGAGTLPSELIEEVRASLLLPVDARFEAVTLVVGFGGALLYETPMRDVAYLLWSMRNRFDTANAVVFE